MGNQPLFDLKGEHSLRYFLRVGTRMSIKSEEERKCQELIQLVSHLTQNTLWESVKRTRKRHIQKRFEGQPRLRAVAVYHNGPTEETIECRRHERVESTRGVSFHPIVRPPPLRRPPPPPEILF